MIDALPLAAAPLVLSALGGLLSERSGTLNISLEGCITGGAFVTALLTALGFPILPAVLAAALTGYLFGALLATVHLELGANLFVAGLGMNLLIPSLSGLASQIAVGHRGTIRIPISLFDEPARSAMKVAAWLMIPLAILSALMLARSTFGIRIRAAGSSPPFLEERGISVRRVRFTALTLSSLAASTAGAFLALRVEAFVPGMSAGRGWIALVMIWLGFRRPAGILLASYFFSLVELISGRAQGLLDLPATLLLALPHLAALAALTLASIGGRNGWQIIRLRSGSHRSDRPSGRSQIFS